MLVQEIRLYMSEGRNGVLNIVQLSSLPCTNTDEQDKAQNTITKCGKYI